ncbi:MAG: hypothetical protein A2Y25_08930 [Candidatus Melainabacteria bacterium GWF2_37_15]|nr:MAG: hypothetical protein A2Y25_08930 [Candidatus Melainabacteria bacterium GWF2_37_15]
MISRIGSVPNYDYRAKPLAFSARWDDLTPEEERKNKKIDRGVSIGMSLIQPIALAILLLMAQCEKANGKETVKPTAQVDEIVKATQLPLKNISYNCESGTLEVTDQFDNKKSISAEALTEQLDEIPNPFDPNGGKINGLELLRGIADCKKSE